MDRSWWETFFDEDYLATYPAARRGDEESQREAEGVARLTGLEPGAHVLDAPVGYARIALPLVRLGYRVTGIDLSQVQLDEARRRAQGVEGLELVRGDVRELPFEDGRFDAALNLFTSIGYFGEEGDLQMLRELRRVLRPGGTLVITVMHRDRAVSIHVPRTWDHLPDGGLFLQERSYDFVAGTSHEIQTRIHPDGRRASREFTLRSYAIPELLRLLDGAGFDDVVCAGGFEGEPVTQHTRLVVTARG
jgi:SAM-dependent methyltransferase